MSLFRRQRKAEPATRISRPPLTPDGTRVYAFGDVHGRVDLLDRLRVAIAQDLERSPVGQAIVIGLGDYMDRGPDSRCVVELLIAGLGAVKTIPLRGNHEQVLISFLDDPVRHGPFWLRFGGDSTLRSYGIDARLYSGASHDYKAIRDELAQRRASRDIREMVRQRVLGGMCDAEIAAELHYPPGTVAGIRRSLGLKANPRYPRRSA